MNLCCATLSGLDPYVVDVPEVNGPGYGVQHEVPSTAWSKGAPLGLDFCVQSVLAPRVYGPVKPAWW